jgi:23S rRNA pseudouridine2605 synthase
VGDKADQAVDVIAVDGRLLPKATAFAYYLLYKPRGVEVTNKRPDTPKTAPRPGRGNTLAWTPILPEILPPDLRGTVFPVGRLDQDSEGLLLLTNDGELALRLTHPRFDHEKEYRVQLQTAMGDDALERLRAGMVMDGRQTKPLTIKRVSSNTLLITLTEGKNRQVRRMCETVGCTVRHLTRVRIGPIGIGEMRPGDLRPLTDGEIEALRAPAEG